MKLPRLLRPWPCLLMAAIAGGLELRAAEPGRQSLLFSGTIKDYVYPAPEFVLKGGEAVRQRDGTLLLRDITVETRRKEDEINLVLRTPSCLFEPDPASRKVTSTSALEVVGQDGRFLLTGSGYDFLAGTNQLSIRSNVVTRFDRSFFGRTNAPAPKAPPTNAFFNISSQQAEFNGVTGAAAWRRDVLATDGEAFSVKAGSLEFNIASLTNAVREFIARDRVEIASRTETGSANASGEKAKFSAEPGLDARVELEGRPAWSHGLLSGRAGHLVWESITNRYRLAGTDGAHLRFPQSMLTTNQAGTNLLWIDLTAGHHEFVPGRFSFGGGVEAKQDTNWTFAGRELVATLDATNRPTRITADGDFRVVVREPGRAGEGHADRAVFDTGPDGRQVATLTGSPRWLSPDLETKADRIVVTDPLGMQEVEAEGGTQIRIAAVDLAGLDWFAGNTNRPATRPATRPAPTNREPLLVTADRYRFSSNRAEFAGNVHGTQGTNSFAAERVTLWLTPQRGLQRLLAVGDVVLRQGGTVLGAGQLNAEFDGEEGGLIRADATDNVRICGRQAGGAGRATGRELGFLATTGDATLLGDPELIFWQSPIPPKEGETGKPRAIPPIRHSGDQIIWNLRTGSIRGEGQYRVLTLPADVEIPRDCD